MEKQSRPQANLFAKIAIGYAIILMCELAWLVPSLMKAATRRTPTVLTNAP